MRCISEVKCKHHLFLVSGLINLLLQEVDFLEGLQAVDAVNQNKAVCHGVVMLWEVSSIVEAFGVIKPQLLLHPPVSFHRGYVHVLLCLTRLCPWTTTGRDGDNQYFSNNKLSFSSAVTFCWYTWIPPLRDNKEDFYCICKC